MTKFSFRLEKLLEYRQKLEETAEAAYRETQARRIDAEHDLEGIKITRRNAVGKGVGCLQGRIALEAYLSRLEDTERGQISVIGVLKDEEEQARQAWLIAKQECEVLEKLREKELAEYNLEAGRREQAELDEWAVLRRAA